MLLVRTYVAPSAIHGLGVFAAEPIAKGTKMWEFAPGLDLIVPQEVADKLPAHVRRYFDIYAFTAPDFPGGRLLTFDNSRYINHSEDPNTDNCSEFTFASRDIAEGEEITCDYSEFSTDPEFVD